MRCNTSFSRNWGRNTHTLIRSTICKRGVSPLTQKRFDVSRTNTKKRRRTTRRCIRCYVLDDLFSTSAQIQHAGVSWSSDRKKLQTFSDWSSSLPISKMILYAHHRRDSSTQFNVSCRETIERWDPPKMHSAQQSLLLGVSHLLHLRGQDPILTSCRWFGHVSEIQIWTTTFSETRTRA